LIEYFGWGIFGHAGDYMPKMKWSRPLPPSSGQLIDYSGSPIQREAIVYRTLLKKWGKMTPGKNLEQIK